MPSPVLLKKLLRIEQKLTSIIDSEELEPPIWYNNLKASLTSLEQGAFPKFQEIFCSLNIGSWKFTSINHQILNSILSNLEKLQGEIRLGKYESSQSGNSKVLLKVIFGMIGTILLISGMILAYSPLGLFGGGILGPLGVTFFVIGTLILFILIGIVSKKLGYKGSCWDCCPTSC